MSSWLPLLTGNPSGGPESRVANEINGGNSISSHFINITPPAGAVDTTELALNKGSSLPLSTRNPSRGQEAMLKMWKPDFQSFKYLYTQSELLTTRNPSQSRVPHHCFRLGTRSESGKPCRKWNKWSNPDFSSFKYFYTLSELLTTRNPSQSRVPHCCFRLGTC